MLVSSHSLPNVHTATYARGASTLSNASVEKRNGSEYAVFGYNASASILSKIDTVVSELQQESASTLSGSSLELLSLALVKGERWPVDVALAWKHDASSRVHTVFIPGEEKNWTGVDALSEEQISQSIEICCDAEENYAATKGGETWKASGKDAFFKIMLAINAGVDVDVISDKQAVEFRRDLSEIILEQRVALAGLLKSCQQDQIGLEGTRAAIGPETITTNVNAVPISVVRNPDWVDLKKRPTCKYSPVIVSDLPNKGAMKSMQDVLSNRIEICRELSLDRGMPGDGSWFSFIRGPQLHEPHLHNGTVPAIVISGGSANKLSAELGKDYSLAWHPMNMRRELDAPAEPVYLLVHKLDYPTYSAVMKEAIELYPNLHLIGWDGGKLTGFGAARASALAFADTLSYRPDRIIMVDQDVVKTEQTRLTSPTIRNNVETLHQTTKQPVVGYGVGYPTRQPSPPPFSETLAPKESDLNSPAQQFVSIQAPYRNQWDDGVYPPYMVAGGEDMLMGIELGLVKNKRNTVLPEERIIKKELEGPADIPNSYWDQGRSQTLKALFESERNIMLEFENQKMSLDSLMSKFEKEGWVTAHPSDESYNVAACIVERIILKLNKELVKEGVKYPRLSRALSA